MALPVLWFIRKEITKQVSYELLALRAIKIFSKDFNWSSVWINRLRLWADLFRPLFGIENGKYSAAVAGISRLTDAAYPLRVHTVFHRFRYLDWTKNLSLTVFADLIRGSLNLSERRAGIPALLFPREDWNYEKCKKAEYQLAAVLYAGVGGVYSL